MLSSASRSFAKIYNIYSETPFFIHNSDIRILIKLPYIFKILSFLNLLIKSCKEIIIRTAINFFQFNQNTNPNVKIAEFIFFR